MKNQEPEYIIIGTVLSPWGVKGQFKVDVETDFPDRFSPSARIYIGRKPAVIETVNWHKGRAIIKVESVNDEKEARKLNKKLIEIHHSQLFTLPEGQYYHFQLAGLEVRTTEGEILGRIKEVLSMASADVYVITGKTGEILVPATDEIVKSIDLNKRCVVIEPVDGLLDLNRKKVK